MLSIVEEENLFCFCNRSVKMESKIDLLLIIIIAAISEILKGISSCSISYIGSFLEGLLDKT